MSFPAYTAYKNSGVDLLGDYPSHWILKRFKNVFDESAERSLDGSEELLSVSAYFGVKPRSATLEEGDHLSRAESLEGYKVCKAGELVINIMLAWNRGLGFSWQYGIVSPAYSVFHIKDGSYPKFMDFLVRSDECIRYFKTHSAGIMDSRLRLYPESFLRLYTATPPVEEQTQIARFLDHETARIDALIEEQQRLIELLKEKRQAVIFNAVTKGLDPTVPMKDTGVEWLGEVPAYWEVKRIKHLAKVISKGTTPTTIGEDFQDDGVRFIKAENIFGGSVLSSPEFFISECVHASLARSALAEYDVLVVIAGATTGKSAVLSVDLLPANTNQAVSFIRLRDTRLSKYIQCWISTDVVQRFISLNSVQSAQPNLSMEDLGEIPVPFPPLEEIELIIDKMESQICIFDGLISEAVNASGLLNERRSALISAAVTGKIDVRAWKPPASAKVQELEAETM